MSENTHDGRIKIDTPGGTRFVDEKDVVHFQDGLLGFPGPRDYVFFDITGCEPFKSMLTVEPGGPDFVVVETGQVFENYNPLELLSDGEVNLGASVELAILSIVTLAEDPEDTTANLSGPLLVNLKTGKGKQVVLSDERYKTQQRMLVGA